MHRSLVFDFDLYGGYEWCVSVEMVDMRSRNLLGFFNSNVLFLKEFFLFVRQSSIILWRGEGKDNDDDKGDDDADFG